MSINGDDYGAHPDDPLDRLARAAVASYVPPQVTEALQSRASHISHPATVSGRTVHLVVCPGQAPVTPAQAVDVWMEIRAVADALGADLDQQPVINVDLTNRAGRRVRVADSSDAPQEQRRKHANRRARGVSPHQ
ncbi:hypothetical protein GCM10023085_46190 [Actinomadura viridis]|uniref:Uncharacterized protein n=1 Tax=Actinomadura viridis TaxID=58110 RepID=A0A931DJP5_9ACTN|nr:hypothetical protein [Actinomadura viridis]MBG6089979.1 hypothetical protein [Actinomadura viridis]